MDPKAKEVFFVRSFTRHRVLKRGRPRATRIKPAMEVVSVHYPHSFGRETGALGITKLVAAHLNGFLLARGPSWPFVAIRGNSWPFVAILACCKQFKKATTEWRFCIWLYITTTTHWLLLDIWSKKRGRKKKSNLQNTTPSKNKKTQGNTNSA